MKQLIDFALDKGIELEIYSEEEQTYLIHILQNYMNQYEVSDVTTYRLKGLYQGKTVILNMEDISDFNEIVRRIQQSSSFIDNNDQDELSKLRNFTAPKKEMMSFEGAKIKEELLSYHDFYRKNPLIKAVESEVIHTQKKIVIQNRYGTMCDYEHYTVMLAEVTAFRETESFVATTIRYEKDYDSNIMKQLLKEASEQAIDKLGATSCKTNFYQVLFDHQVVAELLNYFSQAFHAKKLMDKQSFLNLEDYQTKIFSDLISIVEDPLNDNFVGTKSFDSEGILKRYQKIVDRGIFSQKLYDIKSALKENVESTGNSGEVRNFYIVPGKESQQELIKQMQNGILITNVEGIETGIQQKTGHISLQAQGYEIKDGKKDKFLNMIVVTTNFKEMMNSVLAVGNDLIFRNLSCGAPSILCHDIAISGNL